MSKTAAQHTGILSPSLSQRKRNLDGWREHKFSDFVLINPRTELKNRQEYPFVEMKNLNKNRKKIYSTQMRKLKGGSRFINGDTLFARITPCLENGKICQVDKLQGKQGIGSTEFLVFREKENVSYSDFIYYVAKWSEVRDFAELNMSGTSGRQRVLKTAFDELMLELPPLPEQKAIAEVLSSLDDKIDLLHRQNKTLEDMAQALFRKWFVEEADEGWEEESLGEVVDISIGRTPPRKEFKWFSKRPEDIKWISIKDMGDSGVYIFDTSEYLTKEAVRKFNIPTIPRNTVVLSFKMTVGRVGITTEEMLSNEAIAQFRFNTETPFSKEYLYLYLKTFKFDSLGSTSSIVTSINSSMIKEMLIAMPDYETMNKFQETSEQLFKRIFFNQSQIRTLENLRDTLLPKLMSGAVRARF